MKGKVKVFYVITVCVLAAVLAGLIFSIGINKNKIVEAVGVSNDDYTFVDTNNVVISVEKVAISADDSKHTQPLYTQPTPSTDYEINKMLVEQDEYYYYQNIVNNGKSKYVLNVDSDGKGGFVMLNNNSTTEAGNPYNSRYENSIYDGHGQKVNMSEALLLSVGQYVLYEENGETREGLSGQTQVENTYGDKETLSARLTDLNLKNVTLNGKPITLTDKNARQFGNYFDLAVIIPQTSESEGLYSFEVEYRVNDRYWRKNISFYLLHESNYNANVADTNNRYYSLYPTLSLGSAVDAFVNNAHHYFLGKSLNNYPTITYDISKFALKYTHKANGVITNYTVTQNVNGDNTQYLTRQSDNALHPTISYEMGNYTENGHNVGVLVFTEPGEYTFNFEYLYKDKTNGNILMVNELSVQPINLVIHGFELNYSPYGKLEASMKKLTFALPQNAATNSLSLGLAVVDGYMQDKAPSDLYLGVMYDLDTASTEKVGTVVALEDAAIQTDAKTISGNTIKIDELQYVKSNLPSFRLASNETYVTNDSFYYYALSKERIAENFRVDSSNRTNALNYNNTVTFNKTGYYLVFIRVSVNGLDSDTYNYYQIFAFQYTAETVNAQVKEEDTDEVGKVLGSFDYTSKNIVVSWQEPTTFERKIRVRAYSNGKYYFNNYTTTKAFVNDCSYVELENSKGTLLNDVEQGSGKSYAIEIKSEGISASYTIINIDKEPIKSVNVYEAERAINLLGSTIYRFKGNSPIDSAITSSLATLFWADKASGATINAYYSFTPFVKTSNNEGQITQGTEDIWNTTSYRLGQTVGRQKFVRATQIGADLDSRKVLTESGIYLFTIEDIAGNSCKYMFVIDKTEAFFLITYSENQNGSAVSKMDYLSGGYKLYTTDITVDVGTHKAFKLEASGSSSEYERELFELINIASSFMPSNLNSEQYINQLKEHNYYTDDANNRGGLLEIFKKFNNGTNYLRVKNRSLTAYNSTENIVAENSLSEISGSRHSVLISHGLGASTIRNLYLLGANQRGIDARNSNSNITVEINTDNSRGMAYYGNNLNELISNVPINGSSSTGATRLVYEGYDGHEFDGTHATGDNFLAFTWVFGTTSAYEVKTVSYEFYELTLEPKSAGDDFSKFFYKQQGDTTILYDKSTSATTADVTMDNANDRAIAVLRRQGSQTRAGLYILHREYVNPVEEGDTDKTNLTYYFIVDRNGIIVDDGNNINGGNISIGIRNNESRFNNFNSYGEDKGRLQYYDDNLNINSEYNIYLESNRLPAVLNIPVGKYFYNENYYSNYYAGKLNFSVFYINNSNQVNVAGYNNTAIKLFSVSGNPDDSGYFALDFSNIPEAIRQYFIRKGNLDDNALGDDATENDKDNATDWLCLPGDYVVVISDKVETSADKHTKVIGFRIVSLEPQAEIYSKYELESENIKAIDGGTKTLLTNQKYVFIEMDNQNNPLEFIGTRALARLDLDYLRIWRTINGETNVFINYQHNSIFGPDINGSGNNDVGFEKTADGRIIRLNVSMADYKQKLSYTIRVRYNVTNNDGGLNDYANCYYYYDENGQLQQCYFVEYTVIIDREPPKNNLERILSSQPENDAQFIRQYLGVNDLLIDTLFEVQEIEAGEFKVVRRYINHVDGDNSNLTALRVNKDTALTYNDVDETDTVAIFYKELSANETIVLSYDEDYYTPVQGQPETFGNIGLTDGKFYQIMEKDAAGNATVYIVLYDEDMAGEHDNLSFDLNLNMATSNQGIVDRAQTFKFYNDGDDLNITTFKINSGNVYTTNDRWFILTLTKNVIATTQTSTVVGEIKTYLGYDFVNLTSRLTEMFYTDNNLQLGNYVLTLKSRTETIVYTINVYNQTKKLKPAKELVEYTSDGSFFAVNLSNANDNDEENGIYYYAKTIYLKQGDNVSVYECDASDGYNYYLVQGANRQKVDNNRLLNLSGTYEITLVDCFNLTYPEVATYHYAFSTTGKQPFALTFGQAQDANLRYYDEATETYYSYLSVNINYDAVLYSDFNLTYTITINNSIQTISGINKGNLATADNYHLINFNIDENDPARNVLTINPYFDETLRIGAVVKVAATIIGTNSQQFTIVLDSDTGNISLKTNNDEKNYNTNINVEDISSTEAPTTNVAVGKSTLSWARIANNYFKYSYKLYQEGVDGYISLNDINSFDINTSADLSGVYRFVVEIYTADNNTYLGNKVYTFVVQTSPNEDYYVTEGLDKVVTTDIKVYFTEVSNLLTKSTQITTSLNISTDDIRELTKQGSKKFFYLYISTADLMVNVASSRGLIYSSCSFEIAQGYSFVLYRIYSRSADNSTNSYIGTLKVAATNNLVENLKFADNDLSGRVNYRFSKELGEKSYYELSGKQTKQLNGIDPDFYPILNKNSIVLEIGYNKEEGGIGKNNLVQNTQSAAYNEEQNTFNFKIHGSGKYTFVFKDVAGNSHQFTYFDQASQPQTSEELNIELMLEVVVLVNGDLAVDNAYYNGYVHVKLYQSGIYDIGSIMPPTVTLNGEPYTASADPDNGNYSYLFTAVGVYQITFQASYTPISSNGLEVEPSILTRTLVFTIINPNEVRRAFDISAISRYDITSVVFNNNGVDKSSQLFSILAERAKNNYLIDIDLLLQYSYLLNITAGNIQYVTVTYVATNENDISREISFTFALNDRTPTVECSLKPGETTTKGFTITYNPSIIYSQVGDCQLLINDLLVADINAETVSDSGETQTFTVNYGDEFTEGDYYVVLRGKSPGNVHISFKVSLKEPLNKWSIVFIVVVVLIFATIIGIIIFLRVRMKVR